MSHLPLQFSKEELDKITELLRTHNLSETSRALGLNDMKLANERKRNSELDEAIKKGIELRGSNFKYKQAKKSKERKVLSLKENKQCVVSASYLGERDAIEKYRRLVAERKESSLRRQLQQLQDIDFH